MPNFLKTLFKPSSRTASSHPHAVTPSGSPLEYSPASPGAEDRALREIAEYMQKNGDNGEGLGDGTMQRLLTVLAGIRDERSAGRVSPYLASDLPDTQRSSAAGDGGPWGEAIRACEAAIDATAGVEIEGVKACGELLRGHKSELLEMRPYAENKQLPNLLALAELYRKTEKGLREAKGGQSQDSKMIKTVLQLLQDGSDYLIDTAIVHALVWQAEVIDPSLGGRLRGLLPLPKHDESRFRATCNEIFTIIEGVDQHTLDDELAGDAYLAMRNLGKQLQLRLPRSEEPALRPASAARTPSGLSAIYTPPLARSLAASSPAISPSSTRASTPTPTHDGTFEQLDAKSLQARFGTGPLPSSAASPSLTPSIAPTPSARPSATPNPAARTPDSPVSPAESEQSIWEYRGQLLTRSALELVMRQEALAAADSSGQYAGEVSWDDLREAWIPKWADKLKPGQVAEGEVPTTNPADYTVRKKDAWGNKVGWYDGNMYYEEDPTFDG